MYLIIGASGYLGTHFIKAIRSQTGQQIIATSQNISDKQSDPKTQWEELEIGNQESMEAFAKKIEPITSELDVIYLAAYHHPDKVEAFPQLAWNINITGLAFFFNRCGRFRSLHYASTDSVYGESVDGKIFTESDQCNPLNLYGKHKLLAENITLTYGYNVVRYPFLIGKSLSRTPHFYDKILVQISRGEGFEMFADSYRNTLDFNQAASLTLQLITKSFEAGIVNISADKALSKYDVGMMIANQHHISTDLIIPISANNSTDFASIKRANSTLIDNMKIKKLLNLHTITLVIDE